MQINSPGGDRFEGIAIYNLLRAHPAKVTVEVLGIAASAIGVGGITFTATNKIELKLTHSSDDTTYDPVTEGDVLGVAAARTGGFLGFGFYPRSGFIHVDLGPARQWGERFPVRATAFAAETPPACKVLADSRTMRGGGGDAGRGWG